MWDSEEGSTKNSRRVECQSKNCTHRYLHIITSNQKIYLKKKKKQKWWVSNNKWLTLNISSFNLEILSEITFSYKISGYYDFSFHALHKLSTICQYSWQLGQVQPWLDYTNKINPYKSHLWRYIHGLSL